jgi:tRNA1(Val) A37 N6-methylase TrmN6
MLVSQATKNNWERLDVRSAEGKLSSRANKRLSKKQIVPTELFTREGSVEAVRELVSFLAAYREEKSLSLSDCLFSLALHYLRENLLLDARLHTDNPYLRAFVQDAQYHLDEVLLSLELPDSEEDILGILYQCLQTEGRKNRAGSYYTPKGVVLELLSGITLSPGQRFLVPCCGTGVFLMHVSASDPAQLYGFDSDPIAVMIAKANLFVRYKEHVFDPRIACVNTLDLYEDLWHSQDALPRAFNYIVTNPPWGAFLAGNYGEKYPEIQSGESFSYFLVKSHRMLLPGGEIRFLLPQSFLNVKVHADIRKYLFETMSFSAITVYPKPFTGVLTQAVAVHLKNGVSKTRTTVSESGDSREIDLAFVKDDPNFVLSFFDAVDTGILNKVYSAEHGTLEHSRWALGIVTGDNKGKLSDEPGEGYEPIYTGKEIAPFRLLPCRKYIRYDRSRFQQVAPDDIYRAPEKLVYRFISKNLTFAYDDTGSLFLNSANILIPQISGMRIKTALAFLNSELFQYIYRKKFGEIKILKGNLLQLPFPVIPPAFDQTLAHLADRVLSGEAGAAEKIQAELFRFYHLTETEISRIRKVVYGKADR